MPGMPFAICLKCGVRPLGELAGLIEPIGRVVGRDDLERAVPDAAPHRRLIGRIARRRAEHPLGALQPAVEMVRGRGTGTAGRSRRTPSGRGSGRRGSRAIEPSVVTWNTIDRLVDQGGHRDQAVDGLGLGEARMADGVVAGRGVAARQQALDHPADHRVVLGVHRDHRPLARARAPADRQHLLVVEPQQRIGHEQLERGVAVPDQPRQLGHHLLARVGHDHVEGVVDHRLLRPLAIVGDHLDHRLAAMLGRERDHRGGAAIGGRDRAAVEVVGVPDPHARELLDMAVAVDPARQHQPAARIDLARGRAAGRSASATMRPPRMPTSHLALSAAVTTVPLRMTRSRSGMGITTETSAKREHSSMFRSGQGHRPSMPAGAVWRLTP